MTCSWQSQETETVKTSEMRRTKNSLYSCIVLVSDIYINYMSSRGDWSFHLCAMSSRKKKKMFCSLAGTGMDKRGRERERKDGDWRNRDNMIDSRKYLSCFHCVCGIKCLDRPIVTESEGGQTSIEKWNIKKKSHSAIKRLRQSEISPNSSLLKFRVERLRWGGIAVSVGSNRPLKQSLSRSVILHFLYKHGQLVSMSSRQRHKRSASTEERSNRTHTHTSVDTNKIETQSHLEMTAAAADTAKSSDRTGPSKNDGCEWKRKTKKNEPKSNRCFVCGCSRFAIRVQSANRFLLWYLPKNTNGGVEVPLVFPGRIARAIGQWKWRDARRCRDVGAKTEQIGIKRKNITRGA